MMKSVLHLWWNLYQKAYEGLKNFLYLQGKRAKYFE